VTSTLRRVHNPANRRAKPPQRVAAVNDCTYTFQLQDANSLLVFSGLQLEVPAFEEVPFPPGTEIRVFVELECVTIGCSPVTRLRAPQDYIAQPEGKDAIITFTRLDEDDVWALSGQLLKINRHRSIVAPTWFPSPLTEQLVPFGCNEVQIEQKTHGCLWRCRTYDANASLRFPAWFDANWPEDFEFGIALDPGATYALTLNMGGIVTGICPSALSPYSDLGRVLLFKRTPSNYLWTAEV